MLFHWLHVHTDAKDIVDNPFFLVSVTYSTIMNIMHCLDLCLLALISALSPNIYLKAMTYYFAWLQVSTETVHGPLKYL